MITMLRRWRCRHFAPLLVDAAEGSLSATAAARVEEHVRRCAECRDELAVLRTLPALLRGAPAPEPRDSWERQRQDILRAVRTADARATARPASAPGWQVVSAMVAVACALAVGAALLRDPGPRSTEGAKPPAALLDDDRVAGDALDLLPGDGADWGQTGAAAPDLPPEIPWLLASSDDVDTPEWVDLRDGDIEELDDLLGGWWFS